jgi:hypothetical protein
MAYEVVGSTTLPSPGDTTFNNPMTINNTGTVGGQWATQPPGYPVLDIGYNYSPTTPGFSFPSYPGWTINDAGVTNNPGLSFGDAQTINGLGNPTSAEFGFIYNNGTFTALPTGQYGSEVTGMNDLGQAVGNNFDGEANSQPFIYNVATGTETPLTFQGITNPVVNDINNFGQLVGQGVVSGQEEGLYLNGQGGVELLAPPGALDTEALGLNNRGQIVGDYTDSACHCHGFLFDIGTQTYTRLDYPNATNTMVSGINDNGLVVGSYTDAHNVMHGMELMVAAHS